MADAGGGPTLVDTGRMQRTVRRPIAAQGIGVHSGQDCAVTVGPAEPDTGIEFTNGRSRFRLGPSCIGETVRCTTVGSAGHSVRTVEHLLAALYGMGIDNAEIQVSGPEVPILDGSSLPWVERLRKVGARVQGRRRLAFEPDRAIAVTLGGSCALATPDQELTLTCVTDFDHPMLGTQAASLRITRGAFIRELAPARTFALAADVERMLSSGLAKGGDLSNALVVYDDGYSDALRVPDECLKHKMLDVIGDLCVLGVRLHAHVTVYRPGHAVNARLVGQLARALTERAAQ